MESTIIGSLIHAIVEILNTFIRFLYHGSIHDRSGVTSSGPFRRMAALGLGCLILCGSLVGIFVLWTAESDTTPQSIRPVKLVELDLPEPPPPKEHPAALLRGQEQVRNQEFSAARQSFRSAVSSAPDNGIAWTHLGAVEALLGNPMAARTAYEKALHIDKNNWMAHYNLGLLSVREGKTAVALVHFETCMRALREVGTREELAAVREDLRLNTELKDLQNNEEFQKLLGNS